MKKQPQSNGTTDANFRSSCEIELLAEIHQQAPAPSARAALEPAPCLSSLTSEIKNFKKQVTERDVTVADSMHQATKIPPLGTIALPANCSRFSIGG